MQEKKLIIIDGYSFLFRAYHSMPPLTNPEGTPVGAVFGFTNMVLKILEQMRPTHIVMVFDSGKKSFRNDIYPKYKANRPPAPENLVPQFPLVREAARALNIHVLEQDHIEADDIIATLAVKATREKENVLIISSDKDLMQLINTHVKMYDAIKAKLISEEDVIEKWGVAPDKMLDLLSMVGDSSDNVPGLDGIGPKTASQLLNEYGNFDNIIKSIESFKPSKKKETLLNGVEKFNLAKKLITLKIDVELDINFSDLVTKAPNIQILTNFLEKHNFKSLLARLQNKTILQNFNSEAAASGKIYEFSVVEIETEQQLNAIKKEFEDKGKVAIYSPDYKNFYCSVDYKTSYHVTDSQNNFIDWLLNERSIIKIIYDIKSFAKFYKAAINAQDVMLMAYSLATGKSGYKLGQLIENYIGNFTENDQFTPQQILNLYDHLKPKLVEEKLFSLYCNIELPLAEILNYMEEYGVKIDKDQLNKITEDLNRKISILEEKIFEEASGHFNIASPKQLGFVLYEKLGLSRNKKQNKQSTDIEALEELKANGHKIAEYLIEWRKYFKLRSTYTEGLIKTIKQDGRVHTKFSQALTSTGRLSSSEPNLQNIPIRGEYGKEIRACFVAEEGFDMISADYSQIELRILAHVAKVQPLINAFKNNEDIHKVTACEIFGLEPDEITQEIRQKAKAINFGIIYGISSFGLANNLGISNSQAADYINMYFKKYPGIKEYMETTKEDARRHGYVTTLLGRRCYIENINDRNFTIRGFAERAAINAPIQGTNADIIKKAMIEIYRQVIVKDRENIKMTLQIHDELLFEARKDLAANYADRIKAIMESVIEISTPLVVSCYIGKNWNK